MQEEAGGTLSNSVKNCDDYPCLKSYGPPNCPTGGKENMNGEAGDPLYQSPLKKHNGHLSLKSNDAINKRHCDIIVTFDLSGLPRRRKG